MFTANNCRGEHVHAIVCVVDGLLLVRPSVIVYAAILTAFVFFSRSELVDGDRRNGTVDRRMKAWTYQMRTIYSTDRRDCGQTHLLKTRTNHTRTSGETWQEKNWAGKKMDYIRNLRSASLRLGVARLT